MRQKDIRPAPARIEFKGMKFLITDRPSDATIQSYLMVSRPAQIIMTFLLMKPLRRETRSSNSRKRRRQPNSLTLIKAQKRFLFFLSTTLLRVHCLCLKFDNFSHKKSSAVRSFSSLRGCWSGSMKFKYFRSFAGATEAQCVDGGACMWAQLQERLVGRCWDWSPWLSLRRRNIPAAQHRRRMVRGLEDEVSPFRRLAMNLKGCWRFWCSFQIQRESRGLCSGSLRCWVGQSACHGRFSFDRVGAEVRRCCWVDQRVSSSRNSFVRCLIITFPSVLENAAVPSTLNSFPT